jgi:hypothetical protein
MVIVRDGTSVISGGLDHWYEREGEGEPIDAEEFKIEEWRLQRRLGVDHFRQPPDYRDGNQAEEVPNTGLTVPFLRFPQWHFCPERTCRQLWEVPLTERSRVKCPACERNRRTRYLVQVPFVAMCGSGHIQDFPWREWVHKNASPTCDQPIRLRATGGASLGAQMVECDCGAKRSLASITEASQDDSFLSRELEADGGRYSCRGKRPWLGGDADEECDRPVRGTLRSASNVYYAQVKSAIYLPRGSSAAPSELVEMLQNPPFSSPIRLLVDAGAEVRPQQLRKNYPEQLRPYTDDQVQEALRIILSGEEEEDDYDRRVEGDDIETAFRRAEFEVLKTDRDESQLTIQSTNVRDYDQIISRYFSRVMLVPKLRETRALAGFSRVLAENDQDLARRKSMLWRHVPEGVASWLPAYIVFGEGIMLEFDEERLREWERREAVVSRVATLANNYSGVQQSKGLRQRDITPRFVLLHTFAHLLMNRLTFECGYSSASLRERLFVSSNLSAPMAGLLIYTAAGDADGTMGGLVRMGKRGNLEPAVTKALAEAQWCSADPVCMEMGRSGGQGPDSCNLAACHSCALVPETACEEFNRFLDRALVVGDFSTSGTAYFEELF